MCQYNWEKDWQHKSTDTQTGWKRYTFESYKVVNGSRCTRQIFADSLEEAAASLTPPQW